MVGSQGLHLHPQLLLGWTQMEWTVGGTVADVSWLEEVAEWWLSGGAA